MDELQAYIHEQSFAGFISFSSGDGNSIAAFEKDTGISIDSLIPKTGLDAMIDKATGRRREFVKSFIEWCADQYGREFLPDDLSVFMTNEKET